MFLWLLPGGGLLFIGGFLLGLRGLRRLRGVPFNRATAHIWRDSSVQAGLAWLGWGSFLLLSCAATYVTASLPARNSPLLFRQSLLCLALWVLSLSAMLGGMAVAYGERFLSGFRPEQVAQPEPPHDA
jgi:hypothetical protein